MAYLVAVGNSWDLHDIGGHQGRKTFSPEELGTLINIISGIIMNNNKPGSAEGPMPGTIFEGEKQACSMSWK
jgi:hypothetical protein